MTDDNEVEAPDELLDALYRINSNLWDIRRATQWILAVLVLIGLMLFGWLTEWAIFTPDVEVLVP